MEEIVVQDNEQNKRVDAYIAEAKTELSRTTIKANSTRHSSTNNI